MSFTTPLFIPLVNGLDLTKEAQLGAKELTLAENIDYAVEGRVQGRPSRIAPHDFLVRDPAGTVTDPSYKAVVPFNSTGFTPRGLMKLREATETRPMLGCDGRLFSHDGAQWNDRGHFAAARVDRLHNYNVAAETTSRTAVAPDFGVLSGGDVAVLLSSNSTYEREYALQVTVAQAGGSARCGTTTATVVRVGANALYALQRDNGTAAVIATLLAGDVAAWANDGDAPAICCSADATVFWIAYFTTVAGEYKVLRYNPGTGAVTHTYTGTRANAHGIWLDNTAVADDRVIVAISHSTGVEVQSLKGSDMTSAVAAWSYAAGVPCYDVVVGVDTATQVWIAFRKQNAVAATTRDLYVICANPTTSTMQEMRRYYGGGGATTYSIVHQPIKVGGRMYLTLGFGVQFLGCNSGTWVTLDLSNVKVGTLSTGPFAKATLAARGVSNQLAMEDQAGSDASGHLQPESAVALADGSGWVFVTNDWTVFDTSWTGGVLGRSPIRGLNRVTFSGPRAVIAGGANLISGSVPHMLAGGSCFELGFPMGGPNCSAYAEAAGGVANGDYAVQAVWRYTDDAGQVYRSAPSPIRTVTIGGGNNTLSVEVTNPYCTERPDGEVKIEIYVTGVNPTSTSAHYLQTVVEPTWNNFGTTKVSFTTNPSTTTTPLYTDSTEFIHTYQPADGGVAVVGNRVWMASANSVYASLLLQPNKGVAFNDGGSMQVNLPAGAGRILALEGLDDKLIIFCERGVYATQDGGPNNVGLGPDLPTPVRLSEIGLAGPRASTWTDRGLVFCAPPDTSDPMRGGPWLLDRSLGIQYVGHFVHTAFSGGEIELAYSPERQQLYIMADDAVQATGDSGVVVLDVRTGKWAVWNHEDAKFGALRSIETVGGILWTLGTEPAPFSGTPGTDGDGKGDYAMKLRTAHYAANGADGLGWASVRAISVLAADDAGANTLTITAIQDTSRTSSTSVALTADSAIATWPSNRQAPEWRLPTPKCSTLQVQLSATPATARWAAIRLDVLPRPGRAPAKNRS